MEHLPPRRPRGDLDLLKLILGSFGDFFKDSDIVGDILKYLGQHDVDIEDLQDKTQTLENVIGYGCLTSSGGSAIGSKGVAFFDVQIGPMVGVTRAQYGWILGSKGLWRADAMIHFDFYNLGSNQLDMDIRVYAPDGSLFAQRFNHTENAARTTLTSLMSFVVPASGYRVEVWVQGAIGRGIFGGNSYASLNVTKISGETS